MAFFNSFTDSIRQKWLQFFQVNHDWITLHMKTESVYTPDGGKRPPSYLILGVVNALEPKLAQLMLPFSKLNPDADTLIEVLDLHFDPDIALGNRFMPPAEPEVDQYESAAVGNENSEDETLAISHTNSFAREAMAMAQEFAIQESHNGLGDISLTNGHNSSDDSHQASSIQVDDFGDISFDATTATEGKLDEQLLDELNTQEENAFSDVLSDVWGDQTALHKGEDNNDFLGEELPAGVFDESEIARLFPNA
ncbi:DUF5331 domain-containing protein [Nostocaceae cyanobacterium CENA357]|uniref:DUF5331 domain-containing protein n=1 Tax=Atlanticothrix silvestris CENA357 TaxID=1725252 RepID=A0A8J7HID6_9CYAN|nr:DUF5331 domain-containing protein [Atlanticothrix silvestris]MBH8552978.1 DUF5331 domain-containing protein [Atlanticothrix silvestris CENA357]